MRILQINKFFYGSGGAETVMFRTAELLRANGHEVAFLAMQDPRNVPCSESGYFPRGRYYGTKHGLIQRVLDAGASIYSVDARRALRQLLQDRRPDVAHLHNVYHQLTLSVVDELTAHRIPIVMTIHDGKPICPNYKLYTEGAPCRRCVNSHPGHAIVHRCIKGSRTASAIGAAEALLARTRRSYERIDAFIIPSKHLADVMLQGGLPADRIQVLPNFIADKHFGAVPRRAASEPFALFVGRLEEDKGIQVLLSAAARVADEMKIVVVGGGCLRREVREAEKATAIQYLGQRGWPDIADLMDQARALVVPSLVEENCPMVVVEAGARGCPVIASDRGGLTELVRDGKDGFLFPAGDSNALVQRLRALFLDDVLLGQMSIARHRRTVAQHAADTHYRLLLRAYESAIERVSGSR